MRHHTRPTLDFSSTRDTIVIWFQKQPPHFFLYSLTTPPSNHQILLQSLPGCFSCIHTLPLYPLDFIFYSLYIVNGFINSDAIFFRGGNVGWEIITVFLHTRARAHTQNIRTFPSISVRISGIFQNLSEKKKTTTFPYAQGVAVATARA